MSPTLACLVLFAIVLAAPTANGAQRGTGDIIAEMQTAVQERVAERAAQSSSELMTSLQDGDSSDLVSQTLDELIVNVETSKPNEFQMVAGILNRLKARLEREFEGQRQTCARQLAELRDRIAVRKEKIATNKDKIEQLLNDVERRNRERRADMVLLEKVRVMFADHEFKSEGKVEADSPENEASASFTANLEDEYSPLDVGAVDVKTVDIRTVLAQLMSKSKDAKPEEVESINKLLGEMNTRLEWEMKNDPAYAEIEQLKVDIARWELENEQDEDTIVTKKEECRKLEEYAAKFMRLLQDLFDKLNELMDHSDLGGHIGNETYGIHCEGNEGKCMEENERLKDELNKLRDELERKDRELEDLKNKLKDCGNKDDEKCWKELEDCKNSTDTCKKKNDGLDEDLIKCEGEKKRCEDDHDDCKDDHKECEKEKQKIKDDAEEKIEECKEAHNITKIELEKCRKKNKEDAEELEECEDKKDQCHNDHNETKTQCADDKEDLEDELEKCKKDRKDDQEKCEEDKKKCSDDAEDAAEKCKEEQDKCEKENEDLKDDIEKRKKKCHKINDERDSEAEEADKENQKCKDKLEEQEERCHKINEERDGEAEEAADKLKKCKDALETEQGKTDFLEFKRFVHGKLLDITESSNSAIDREQAAAASALDANTQLSARLKEAYEVEGVANPAALLEESVGQKLAQHQKQLAACNKKLRAELAAGVTFAT